MSELDAVTTVADTHALGFTGEELWLDWLLAQPIRLLRRALYQLLLGLTWPYAVYHLSRRKPAVQCADWRCTTMSWSAKGK